MSIKFIRLFTLSSAFLIARRKPENVAFAIPFLLISATLATPTPQVKAFFLIHLKDFSLCKEVIFLESFIFIF
jgi:hypothetical protein